MYPITWQGFTQALTNRASEEEFNSPEKFLYLIKIWKKIFVALQARQSLLDEIRLNLNFVALLGKIQEMASHLLKLTGVSMDLFPEFVSTVLPVRGTRHVVKISRNLV